MRLPGKQLVLDTNVLVHLIRGGAAGAAIERAYAVGARKPRALVPVVVKGEIKSLALQFGWGAQRQGALDTLLAQLPATDISSELVLGTYARLDHASREAGRKMSKNDLWIAAIAHVQQGVLLTTDRDFDHLNPLYLQVEYIDPESLKGGSL